MASPSKQRPFAIEAEYTPGKWYSVEAYRGCDEAEAMLPVTRDGGNIARKALR